MQKIKCCKDCKPPKRYLGCHAECEEYIKERNDYEEVRMIIEREKKKQYLIDDYIRSKRR